MGHGHARHAAPGAPRPPRSVVAALLLACLVTVALMVWLWPSSEVRADDQAAAAGQVEGVVEAINTEPCPEPEGTGGPAAGDVNNCGVADVLLTSGPAEGDIVSVDLPNGPGAPRVTEQDAVVLLRSAAPGNDAVYAITDHQRGTQLWVLAAAFVLAVVAFGRWRGVTALVGLAATFGLLLYFVVPAILGGESPLLVAIVGSAAIILVVLPLTHGLSMSTSVAVSGTLASLTITGLLAAATVSAMHLTGFADESSTNLGVLYGLNLEGLLLAGIVIGSLGVLDDVTVTQAATVEELARANPGAGFLELYRSASRVGRSHIASVINTIILAYAGSSLPLMILIAADGVALRQVLPDQIIAQEIVRSVVATLGLISAVPITTALAAAAASGGARR